MCVVYIISVIDSFKSRPWRPTVGSAYRKRKRNCKYVNCIVSFPISLLYFLVFLVQEKCDQGWRDRDQTDWCYFLSSGITRTWESAREYCSARDADLISVMERTEQVFIDCKCHLYTSTRDYHFKSKNVVSTKKNENVKQSTRFCTVVKQMGNFSGSPSGNTIFHFTVSVPHR